MTTNKKNPASVLGAGSVLSTVSGPSTAPPPDSLGQATAPKQALLEKISSGQEVAKGMTFNANKEGEHGAASRTPQPGQTCPVPHPAAGKFTSLAATPAAK